MPLTTRPCLRFSMHRVIYASYPRCPPHAEILDIVRASERNNRGLGCSGVLLFNASLYLQVIERPQDGVARLMKLIRADERHGIQWERVVRIGRRHFSLSLPMGYLAPGDLSGSWAAGLSRPLPEAGDGLAERLFAAAAAKYPSSVLPVA